MDRIIIKGGARLNGEIPISGAKNSALKLMAAVLLSPETVTLTKTPNLADTRFMADLLATLGVEVDWPAGSDTAVFKAAEIKSTIAPYDLVRKMRATFNVLGPLLARVGHATVSLPGGCAIGARPVDLHLKAFEAMGADIHIEAGYVKAAALRGLTGARVAFPFVSVGATEHTMLAAVLAKGETLLENAAREPEIIDLANCLIAMGAKIDGAGTPTITIQGVDSLSQPTKYEVLGDRIEAGTYAIAAAMAGGKVRLRGVNPDHIASLTLLMQQAGISVETHDDGVTIARNGERLTAVDVDTQPFPGFPTDLQAQFMALMTLADGVSVFRENIFENRFMHAPELMRLGADISVKGQMAIVRGVDKLVGAPVMATDLRASVSLVIAGLAAQGETVVNRVYHLDRGFEKLEAKLSGCGAQIERAR